MQHSLKQFLDRVAQQGSWIGGGSVAALTAALAAALLEKLVVHPQQARTLRRVRQECLKLVQHDADTFARAIQASRAHHRRAFRNSLRAATAVQAQVLQHATTIQAVCRLAQRAVTPQLQSDLRCVKALAVASGQSARTLIRTNRVWLNHQASTPTRRRRAQPPHDE